jgi:type IV pilus assembly protein PilZ
MLRTDLSPPRDLMDEDRRVDPRAPIELRVEYKRLNSFFADYTRNISRGGTFIRTDKPLDVNTEFVFKLQIPKLEQPLVLRGRVQWVVHPEDANEDCTPGMGIGFIYENESERQGIEASVEKLMVASLGRVLFDKLVGSRLREP